MSDGRYGCELPSGIIISPKLKIASVDLSVNDVVWLNDDDEVSPIYDDSKKVYGIVAAKGIKGRKVLIATKEHV